MSPAVADKGAVMRNFDARIYPEQNVEDIVVIRDAIMFISRNWYPTCQVCSAYRWILFTIEL